MERIEINEREHWIATELQERLLDVKARSTSAVVSATYEPAGERLRVGGDCYTGNHARRTRPRRGVRRGRGRTRPRGGDDDEPAAQRSRHCSPDLAGPDRRDRPAR